MILLGVKIHVIPGYSWILNSRILIERTNKVRILHTCRHIEVYSSLVSMHVLSPVLSLQTLIIANVFDWFLYLRFGLVPLGFAWAKHHHRVMVKNSTRSLIGCYVWWEHLARNYIMFYETSKMPNIEYMNNLLVNEIIHGTHSFSNKAPAKS